MHRGGRELLPCRQRKKKATLSENQVIYHRGLRSSAEGRTRRAQSFETVFNSLRGSAHSAVESKGMAISLKASMTAQVAHEPENVPHSFGAKIG